MTITVISSLTRPLIEPHLPDWVEPRFFASKEEAFALAPEAEIGWFDMWNKADMAEAISRATKLKWLNSIYAGADGMPLAALAARGTIYTNGAGLHAITIAEYVLMGMLAIAKGYDEIVRANDRHEWLAQPPGRKELYESRALIIGYGGIGQEIAKRLAAFSVDVTVVRRTAREGALGPDEWRARLGEFDWVILAAPATAETAQMIGAAELAAMKVDATLINIARGSLVDSAALVTALSEKQIAAAFLDTTDPEPLPPEHPLWDLKNAHITMHLSGPSQEKMFQRAAARFLDNLDRYHRGEALQPQVNLSLGY